MMTSLIRKLVIIAIAIGIPALAVASDKLVQKDQYSGFLKDYSQLKEEKDADNEPVMRFINPKLTSGEYDKVMIDPVIFFPVPRPDENVDSATLSQIKDYFDKDLRQKIGEQAVIVDKAGPGVARMRIAITAVKAEDAALKPYQYIPFAFIAHSIKKAAGDSAKDADLYAEMEIVDSQSGERLGAVVKKGIGTEVKKMEEGAEKGEKKLVLDNVKPVLDNWSKLAADFAGTNLHPN
jgi:hypothetical protein